MGRLATFLERQQTEITQQISKVGASPFDSSRGGMVADFRVGLRQMVIRNRWPEMMRRMIVHVQRRDEQPLQRITDERNEPVFVRPRLRSGLRMLGESAKVVGRERQIQWHEP